MNRTEQLLNGYMARRGIATTKELGRITGFSQQYLCKMRKEPWTIRNRNLLVLADTLKLTNEELGELVRAQKG